MIKQVTFTDLERGKLSFEVHVNPRLSELPWRVGRFVVACTGDVLAADADEVVHQDMVRRAVYAIREKPTGELERIEVLFAGSWRRSDYTYGMLYQDMGQPYHKLRDRLTTWQQFVGHCELVKV